MEICLLRASTIPQVIVEVMEVCNLRPATLTMVNADNITVVMFTEVYLGHKIPATLTITTEEQQLMTNGEIDIGIIPSTILPRTKVIVV